MGKQGGVNCWYCCSGAAKKRILQQRDYDLDFNEECRLAVGQPGLENRYVPNRAAGSSPDHSALG